jgi:chromosomal replication initiation ATPase DnaA
MLDTEVFQPFKRKKINFKDLIRQVCKEYQLKEKDLTSISRNRNSSEARLTIGWLGLKTYNITLTQVAQYFGRDITTLSLGVRDRK